MWAICDEYAVKDLRIKVIHQENAGLSAARNAGLDMVTGNYILFIDSDDWINEETCETVLTTAEEQQADLVYFGFREVFTNGIEKTWRPYRSGKIEKAEMIRLVVWFSCNIVWNKFYSKELFNGIRFPIGRIYEDAYIMPELVHRAHHIYAIDAILYNYIRRRGSLADNRYSPRSIKDILYVWQHRLEFLKQHYPAHTDKMLKEILRQMIIGHELLKSDPDYTAFMTDFDNFVQEYRPRFKTISRDCRLNKLYCFCPSLAYLYVRWHFRKYRK